MRHENWLCPKCKNKLDEEDSLKIVCINCNSKFPIENNIPILLLDKMEPLDSKDISLKQSKLETTNLKE